MKIQSLASGSAGNCYHITDGETPLLIDPGIRFKEIQQGIDFRVSALGGCLLSHEHGDHSKSIPAMIKAGIDCYMSNGTAKALNLEPHHRINVVEPVTPFTVGSWTILPFPVQHDAAEPFGYLLASRNGGKLLYATDTYYVSYRFRGLTHIMIEANYGADILKENVASGAVPQAHKNRVMRSHMSIDTLVDLLKANDLSKVEEIWLLHLSDGNSDAEAFKKKIMETTGKVTYIA